MRPIVFIVRGYRGTKVVHHLLVSALEDAGHEVHVLGYASAKHDLDTLVRTVFSQIMTILNGNTVRPIALIGHSLGGVITHQIVTGGSIPNPIRCTVLIAAPLHGSSLARLAQWTSITQWFGGPVLTDLASLCTPTPIPLPNVHTLSSGWFGLGIDGRVSKHNTTLVGASHRHFPWSDHSLMMLDRRVINHLVLICTNKL